MVKNKTKYIKYFILILALFLFYIFQNRSKSLYSVGLSLKLAGDNKIELEKVLDYFKTSDDELKYEAAKFLIRNMIIHSNHKVELFDKNKKNVKFNPFLYKKNKAKQVKDSLLSNNRVVRTTNFDIKTIKSDYLIKYINIAFAHWKSPLAKHLSFEQFCEFLLPYRILNEDLSDWITQANSYYQPLLDRLDLNSSDSLWQVREMICKDLAKKFWYSTKDEFSLYFESINDLKKSQHGDCVKYAVMLSAMMRSVGLPIAIDKTTWAQSSGSHFWNVLIGKDKNQSFGSNIHSMRKLGKVYRYSYSAQNEDLYKNVKQEDLPSIFSERNLIDVTQEYTATQDLHLSINKEVEDQVCYLAFFNSGAWRLNAWALMDGNNVCFKNMGIRDIVYLPLAKHQGYRQPVHPPVVMKKDSVIDIVRIDKEHLQTMKLSLASKWPGDIWYYNRVKPGKKIELLYWDNGWVSCGVKEATDEFIEFEQVPSDALYLIQEPGKINREKRPFRYIKGKQIFY